MASTFFATPSERLTAFFDTAQPRTTFSDIEIAEIATLLKQCGHIASNCPRAYILLRKIGHLDVLDPLLHSGFSDQWFPVESRDLPSFLEPSVRASITEQQGIILTKSLDLENGRHRHFAPGEPLPFEILGRLGSGGYSQVDKILSKTSYRQYALKRIRRRAIFGNGPAREALQGFLNEMRIIRSLQNEHIVQYVGSYTDKNHLGLVMSPVADMDLTTFNERLCGYFQPGPTDGSATRHTTQDSKAATEMSSSLRSYFGCLAASLSYLHEQNIRHKDIKPQNILISKGRVLFADFGISRDFDNMNGSTTTGLTPVTPRYCAPEVAAYESRNASSDIWSLGCVFVEMAAALQGFGVDWIKEYFVKSGSTTLHFHTSLKATSWLIAALERMGGVGFKRIFTWVKPMLLLDRHARPTAARILEMIIHPDTRDTDSVPTSYCGICCVPGLDSDSMDSLVDDLDTMTTIPQSRSTPRGSDITRPKQENIQVLLESSIVSPIVGISNRRQAEIHSPDVVSVSRDDIERFYVTKRLEWEDYFRDKGVPHHELKAQRKHTTQFVKEKFKCVEKQHGSSIFTFTARLDSRPHYGVFGAPIWLAAAFTGIKRSTRDDFGIGDKRLQVPIVLAECCVYLANQPYTEIYNACVDLSELSSSIKDTFESHPTFGLDHPWPESEASGPANTLIKYLYMLPGPLIPLYIADELCALPNRSTTKTPRGLQLLPYLPWLRQISEPNRDTLIYLLAFCKCILGEHTLNTAYKEVARFFVPAIFPTDYTQEVEEERVISAVVFMIHYVDIILGHISCSAELGPCRYKDTQL